MSNRDLYATVTNQIVALLETGAGAWQKPWTDGLALKAGVPFNFTTGRKYRGVNVLILWSAASRSGYAANQWASYKQWQAKGAQVRQGEKGTMIVYYGTAPSKKLNDAGEPVDSNYRFLKCSWVFNIAQVDGATVAPEMPKPSPMDRLAHAEEYIRNTGATIRWGEGKAFYAPYADFIGMPHAEQFLPIGEASAQETMYGTLLHELTHWTGHEKRCAREFGKRFGDDAYAVEELVAELGAAFLCAELGISPSPRKDHAAYLASWLKVLKADSKAIFTAAARASDAVEFCAKKQPGEAEELPIAA